LARLKPHLQVAFAIQPLGGNAFWIAAQIAADFSKGKARKRNVLLYVRLSERRHWENRW